MSGDVTVPSPRAVLRDSAKIGLALWDQTVDYYVSMLRKAQDPVDENEFEVDFKGTKIEPEGKKLRGPDGKSVKKVIVDFTPPDVDEPHPYGDVTIEVELLPPQGVTLQAGVYTVDIVNQVDGEVLEKRFPVHYPGKHAQGGGW